MFGGSIRSWIGRGGREVGGRPSLCLLDAELRLLRVCALSLSQIRRTLTLRPPMAILPSLYSPSLISSSDGGVIVGLAACGIIMSIAYSGADL